MDAEVLKTEMLSDKEKLTAFANELKNLKLPDCSTLSGKQIIKDAKDRLNDQAADILTLTKNL